MEGLVGDQESGLAYLGFVLNYPIKDRDLTHNIYQKLNHMNLDPDDPDIQRAMEKGKELELEEICTRLLEEYSST